MNEMERHENSIPFWLVWNPNGSSPRVKHDSLAQAECEAARLARSNPGHEFFVLRPISVTCKSDVMVRRFRQVE